MLGVRREIAAVYRDARQGRIPARDAAQLGSLLAIVARIIAGEDMERRLTQLEEAHKGGRPW